MVAKGSMGVARCVSCVGWGRAVGSNRGSNLGRGAIVTARARRGVEALGGAARVRLSRDFCGFLRFSTYFDRSAFLCATAPAHPTHVRCVWACKAGVWLEVAVGRAASDMDAL
jgi:hypothetical protein